MEKKFIFNFTPTGLIPTKEMTHEVPIKPVEIVEHAVDAFNTMLVEPDKYMDLLNSIEEKAKETWPNYGVQY